MSCDTNNGALHALAFLVTPERQAV
jgi:hypothetical protein